MQDGTSAVVGLLEPTDPRVNALLHRVEEPWRGLHFYEFPYPDGRNREWHEIYQPRLPECVAVAAIDGVDAGLGTLNSSWFVEARPSHDPAIHGLWVHPIARGQGVGTQLLVELAAESQRRFDRPPKLMLPDVPDGLVREARRAGANLIE